jgi:DNA modification methylase
MFEKSMNELIDDPKILPTDKEGVFHWFPFHAAFSSRFVRSVIEHELSINSKLTLFDQFLGSGTTAVVSKLLGVDFWGSDINSFLVKLAQAKLISLEKIKAISILEEVCSNYEPLPLNQTPDVEVMSNQAKRKLFGLKQTIEDTDFSEDYRKWLLTSLLLITREMVGEQKGSNPTWPKSYGGAEDKELIPLFRKKALTLLEDILSMTYQSSSAIITLADAKALHYESDKFDLNITSPPYLSRIDYVINTLPEIILSQGASKEDIYQLRKELMGGVVINKKGENNPDWGKECLRVLKGIQEHPSKASANYYYWTYYDYFHDLWETLKETKRVLKKNGKAYWVVQTSYYKEIEINLPEIIIEMGSALSMKGEIVREKEVKNHLGNLHPDQRRRVPNKVLRESVVKLNNEKT